MRAKLPCLYKSKKIIQRNRMNYEKIRKKKAEKFCKRYSSSLQLQVDSDFSLVLAYSTDLLGCCNSLRPAWLN